MSNSPLVKFYNLLTSLNAYEFTLLSYLLGNFFCEGLNTKQIQSLGNFYESVGQTMLTIGAQLQTLDSSTNTSLCEESIIKELKNKINNIEYIIKNLNNLNI